MKFFNTKHLLPALFLLFSSMAGSAQNCGLYIPLVENRGLQLQSYNHRDRLQSTQEVRVQGVETDGNSIIATMHTRAFDQRDREIHQGSFRVICSGTRLMIDVQSMLDPNMMEGFQGMEVNVESSEVILPSNVSVGQSLPDAELNMEVTTGGVTFADIQYSITGRKVESQETVTVPAGDFECYKISYNTRMETRTMGIPIRTSGKVVEYHAPGIGVVRSENYDSRDRLQGYTVLSEIF